MSQKLPHAGLWGDGDEVEAIELIERRLCVQLRREEAPSIWTVGDLWDCLLKSNENLKDDRRSWIKFVVALTAYPGLDPRQIGRETLLIAPRKPNFLTKLWGRLNGKGEHARA